MLPLRTAIGFRMPAAGAAVASAGGGEAARVHGPDGSGRPDPGALRGEPLWRHIVGDVLRWQRRSQRRTLQQVASAARISTPYLSEIERGRKEPSSEVLAAVARALGLSLADLLALSLTEVSEIARVRRAGLAPVPMPASAEPDSSSGPAARPEPSARATAVPGPPAALAAVPRSPARTTSPHALLRVLPGRQGDLLPSAARPRGRAAG